MSSKGADTFEGAAATEHVASTRLCYQASKALITSLLSSSLSQIPSESEFDLVTD